MIGRLGTFARLAPYQHQIRRFEQDSLTGFLVQILEIMVEALNRLVLGVKAYKTVEKLLQLFDDILSLLAIPTSGGKP